MDDVDDIVPDKATAPQAFVKWALVPEILKQANTNGVRSTVLLKDDGSLLTLAGDERAENIVGALIANTWRTYAELGSESTDGGRLNTVLVACEDGQIAIARTSRFLICLYAEADVPVGALRAKLTALTTALAGPLQRVYPNAAP